VRVAIVGVIGYAALVYVLLSSTPLGWLDALLLAALIELLPVFAVVQVDLVRDLAVERAHAYVTSAVTILVLGVSSLVLGSRLVGMEAMGLRIEPARVAYMIFWSAGTLALGIATLCGHTSRKGAVRGVVFLCRVRGGVGLPGVCDSCSDGGGCVRSGGPCRDVGGFRGPAFVPRCIGGRANWSGRGDHGCGIPPYGERVAADGRARSDRPCRRLCFGRQIAVIGVNELPL